jgi:hypothetical protein
MDIENFEAFCAYKEEKEKQTNYINSIWNFNFSYLLKIKLFLLF